MNLPKLPENSRLSVKRTLDGIVLYWAKPNNWRGRMVTILLLGWCVLSLSTMVILAGLDALPMELPVRLRVMLAAAWGGCLIPMIVLFCQAVRPYQPESVTLDEGEFLYDSGSSSVWRFILPGTQRSRVSMFFGLFRKAKKIQARRSVCSEFVLAEGDAVLFDVESKQVRAGEILTGPDRQWLARVLNAWRTGGLDNVAGEGAPVIPATQAACGAAAGRPIGSAIRIRHELDGVSLFWKTSRNKDALIITAPFFALWLGAWGWGTASLVWSFFHGEKMKINGELQEPSLLFVLGFALGWFVVAAIVYVLYRPQKPETVALEREALLYKAGSTEIRLRWSWIIGVYLRGVWKAMLPRKKFQIERRKCPEFVFTDLGAESTLMLDVGARVFRVGKTLRKSEQKWLAEILNAWRVGELEPREIASGGEDLFAAG